MAIVSAIVGAMLLGAPAGVMVEHTNVAFSDLANGRAEQAIATMNAQADASRDPAVLINLAAAHTRLGHRDEARRLLQAAIASPDRYDVELANGAWMDSRNVARIALGRLSERYTIVQR